MNDKVYVILVNWNGALDTLECLESVLRLDYPHFQVIVCDNDSRDGSVERIVAWTHGEGAEVCVQNPALAHLVQPNIAKPITIDVLARVEAEDASRAKAMAQIVVIRTGGNLGFAGANNMAMRYASGAGDADYFWLLNNDTVVEPAALLSMVARAKEAENRGLVGSTLAFYSRPDALQAMGVFGYSPRRGLGVPIGAFRSPSSVTVSDKDDAEKRAAYVVGASMLVPKGFYAEVGEMCEDYFLYFEELDWSLRGKRHGYRCLYAMNSVVYHKVGASTARVQTNELSVGVRYSYINRLRVTKMHFRSELPWVRLRILLEAFQALAGGRWQEAKFAAALALRPVPQ